jgi:hypothetical protein
MMNQYLLLLHDDNIPDLSPEEMQKLIEDYGAWAGEMAEKGHLLSGEELIPKPVSIKMKNKQIVIDGPYTESKEGIGGFFIIQASTMEEAVNLTKSCPHIGYGGRIVIREMVLRN